MSAGCGGVQSVEVVVGGEGGVKLKVEAAGRTRARATKESVYSSYEPGFSTTDVVVAYRMGILCFLAIET